MKKSLTKILASCAVVASLTAVMAVSASAATTYDKDTATITTDLVSATDAGKQATVLVYKADSVDAEATAETIKFIDQQENAAGLWATIKATLDDGKYVIKMGGENKEDGTAVEVVSDTFTVGAAAGETVLKGDVNGKDGVTAADSLITLRYTVNNDAAKAVINTPKQEFIADVNDKDGVTAADALIILRATVNNESAKSYIKEVEYVPAN